MNEPLHSTFKDIFAIDKEPLTFFAPGRINLIGEHTDYNGGYVFPASISFGTYALVSQREDQTIRFYSMNFPEIGVITIDLATLDYDAKHNWANYPKGMIQFMRSQGAAISNGFDVLYYGNIPNSAGLSSSASIEMVTGVFLKALFENSFSRLDLIQIGQRVENEYIGVNSGIMDQFAIGLGKQDHAIHLDTSTLNYDYAPIHLPEHQILIINTNKERTLHDSKYNERREQCESALHDLQKKLQIQHLCDITPEEFDRYASLITDPVDKRRARHAIYENQRTIEALEQLKQHNLQAFGELMNASHQSLKEDYEVTGIELDTIAETAQKQPGVLGARMTGAGFGGCAIAIVEKEHVQQVQTNIQQIYTEKIGYKPTFYIANIGDQAKQISSEVI